MENWNSHTKTRKHQDKRFPLKELNCEIRKKREKGMELTERELWIERDSKRTTPSLASFGFGKLAKKGKTGVTHSDPSSARTLPLATTTMSDLMLCCGIISDYKSDSQSNYLRWYVQHASVASTGNFSLDSIKTIPPSLQLHVEEVGANIVQTQSERNNMSAMNVTSSGSQTKSDVYANS